MMGDGMGIANGTYKTKAGSTVEISGTHGGMSNVSFDWVEEPSVCMDCRVDPYPHHWGKDEDGTDEWRLYWECECCNGGSARLERIPQVTHEGEITIAGLTIRVSHLDNGQRIIPEEDFHAFLRWLEGGPEITPEDARQLGQVLQTTRDRSLIEKLERVKASVKYNQFDSFSKGWESACSMNIAIVRDHFANAGKGIDQASASIQTPPFVSNRGEDVYKPAALPEDRVEAVADAVTEAMHGDLLEWNVGKLALAAIAADEAWLRARRNRLANAKDLNEIIGGLISLAESDCNGSECIRQAAWLLEQFQDASDKASEIPVMGAAKAVKSSMGREESGTSPEAAGLEPECDRPAPASIDQPDACRKAFDLKWPAACGLDLTTPEDHCQLHLIYLGFEAAWDARPSERELVAGDLLDFCTYQGRDSQIKFNTDFVPQVIAEYELALRRNLDGNLPGAVYNAMESALDKYILQPILKRIEIWRRG